MKMWLNKKIVIVACLFAGGMVTSIIAVAESTSNAVVAENVVSPYLLVEDVTAQVLATIANHRGEIEVGGSDAEKRRQLGSFFTEIDCILAGVIDFDWISRNVMGAYGKSATSAQREKFSEIFQSGLVETYGRGLLSYSDQEIVVLPGSDDYTTKRKVSVRQEIHGVDGNYPMEYTMGLNKSGKWQIINVVINGINLGKTFRNQFVQAAQKNGGDIDAVIANWDTSAS